MEKNQKKRKDAYMVFGYACNQRCLCCPCEKEQRLESVIDLKLLKKEVDDMVKIGVTDVTVSGGEPTIYPNFFEIITYLINKDLNIHILSNSEKFADDAFVKKFIKIVRGKNVTVTTTFHSYKEKDHEKQNNSIGSFNKSLKGLKMLDKNNIQISIKQCITKYNYKDLKGFIKFVIDNFSQNTEIQLWGIDVCGINKELAEKYFIKFEDMKPYIEEAINYFEKTNNDENLLTINNLPLCMCDCYYWKFFTLADNNYYIDYKEDRNIEKNYGLTYVGCKKCEFARYCKGTYLSIPEMFGNDLINEAPDIGKDVFLHKLKYIEYSTENIENLFFSIYDIFSLNPRGLTIFNKKSKFDVTIRLKSEEIRELINTFDRGINKENAIKMFVKFGQKNTEDVINEWMIKGIIE